VVFDVRPKGIAIVVLATLIGCGGAGMGPETRADIQARMQTVHEPIQACYADALRGMVTIELYAEPSTGAFKNITFLRDEVKDPQVRDCIVNEVGKLKLDKPTSARVTINYPFRFMPNN
jgi:hypothetical protein